MENKWSCFLTRYLLWHWDQSNWKICGWNRRDAPVRVLRHCVITPCIPPAFKKRWQELQSAPAMCWNNEITICKNIHSEPDLTSKPKINYKWQALNIIHKYLKEWEENEVKNHVMAKASLNITKIKNCRAKYKQISLPKLFKRVKQIEAQYTKTVHKQGLKTSKTQKILAACVTKRWIS